MRRIAYGLLVPAILLATDASGQIVDNSTRIVGPGSTPGGDMARGMGVYYDGLGNYNVKTAMADSINTDTVIRWNEYVYQSIQVANHKRFLRLREEKENKLLNYEEIHRRIRERPTVSDQMNGDALNVLLEELCDPRFGRSEIRATRLALSGDAIRVVPFQYASLGGIISMRQLAVRDGWPQALRGEAFAALRRSYEQAVDAVLEQNLTRKLTPEAVKAVTSAVERLRARVESAIPYADQEYHRQAHEFVKGLENAARMIRTPLAEDVFASMEVYSGTSVAELVEFMQRYNLRFSPATTPAERDLYKDLYPLLRKQREGLPTDPEPRRPGGVTSRKREDREKGEDREK